MSVPWAKVSITRAPTKVRLAIDGPNQTTRAAGSRPAERILGGAPRPAPPIEEL